MLTIWILLKPKPKVNFQYKERGLKMLGEISYDEDTYESLKKSINKAKEATEEVISAVEKIKSLAESEFDGEAKKSLVSMLEDHLSDVKNKKKNWEDMVMNVENINTTAKETDSSLSNSINSGGLNGFGPAAT